MRSRETELAWAAGFFDGEGSTGITRAHKDRGKAYRCVHITQVDREVLDRFRAAVGGLGGISGPRKNGKWQPQFTFSTSAGPANKILEMLTPFLSSAKKKQAEDARLRAEDINEEWRLVRHPSGRKEQSS